ncbi:APH(6) family putative aminoglycoside O-phosphotransferase [Bordetella bronchiseptica]|nr:APH(6) family putative aminoglycoside O-phosphotransferase [Bordetella bronchiseptica]KDD57690.1 aminoglycoside/hydroxyurea antibiotic resistance kinase [Bordetella bronchiseptica OSU553]RSB96825.1 APH(6) family putative aminoglycoside O-phosphotransferase [Bordetella bronchiseptica]RSC05878.1 APH(6) family putative aminoglycoside O-phosphotransferase [Bordetella bronchiseptica]
MPGAPPSLLPYLRRWSLAIDGQPVETPAACLAPVSWRGQRAMLKVSASAEEARGYDLLEWWGGQGAARVLARAGPAILMERADGPRSLAQWSRAGRDDEACRALCAVIARLHAVGEARAAQADAPPGLAPLDTWFAALQAAAPARREEGVLQAARQAMRALLAQPREVRCLHGDIHHGNVLDFGERGWLAIDPKGLLGERAFDYANLFCNPDREVACDAGRFAARVALVAQEAGLERQRLLQWILAWAGLSAVWHLEDGTCAHIALQVARMAAAALRP